MPAAPAGARGRGAGFLLEWRAMQNGGRKRRFRAFSAGKGDA